MKTSIVSTLPWEALCGGLQTGSTGVCGVTRWSPARVLWR